VDLRRREAAGPEISNHADAGGISAHRQHDVDDPIAVHVGDLGVIGLLAEEDRLRRREGAVAVPPEDVDEAVDVTSRHDQIEGAVAVEVGALDIGREVDVGEDDAGQLREAELCESSRSQRQSRGGGRSRNRLGGSR